VLYQLSYTHHSGATHLVYLGASVESPGATGGAGRPFEVQLVGSGRGGRYCRGVIFAALWPTQSLEHGSERTLEPTEIVATLEHDSYPALGAARQRSSELPHHFRIPALGHPHRRERVAHVRVEPRTDEKEVRIEFGNHGRDDSLECIAIDGVVGPAGKRHVHRVTGAVSGSEFLRAASARIKGPLMQRNVEYGRVTVEHFLSAVSVVHVPVDDRDAFGPCRASVRSGNGDVIQETEAHRRARPCVMPRWPHEGEPVARATAEERIDERDATARCPSAGGVGGRGEIRVGIEIPLPAVDSNEVLDVTRRMNPNELVVRRVSGGEPEPGCAGWQDSSFYGRPSCFEALGPLRVVVHSTGRACGPRRPVLQKERVVDEDNGVFHRVSLT
jgi:hypothetical protein